MLKFGKRREHFVVCCVAYCVLENGVKPLEKCFCLVLNLHKNLNWWLIKKIKTSVNF